MSTIDLFNDKLPLGSDFRYENIFIETEKEIDKLANANDAHTVDWNKVRENSFEIITTNSKDIKVFCWLLFSYFRDNDFNSFLTEGENFKGLLQQYFDDLFPKSKKAKANSFLWLVSKTTNFITQNDEIFKGLSQEEIRNINKFFTDLDEITNDFDLNIYTELKMIIKLLSKFFIDENSSTENNTNTNQAKDSESPKNLEDTHKQAEITPINNDHEDHGTKHNISNDIITTHIPVDTLDNLTMDELKAKSIKYFKNFLEVNVANQNINANSIKINRFISWLDVLEPPKYDNTNTIMLSPPHEHVITSINLKIENKNFEDAFFDIEDIIITSPFWITAHYLSYICLINLELPKLAHLVKNQILQITLLDDNIINCLFNNGLELANDATKQWLLSDNIDDNTNTINNLNPINNNTKTSQEDSKVETEVEIEIETPNKLNNDIKQEKSYKSSGSFSQDMNNLQEDYTHAPSLQAKVITRLKQARLCIDNNMYQLAFQISSEVEKELMKLEIDMWDPPLYCDSLLVMNESLSYIYDPNYHQEIFSYLTQKLSLLNPSILIK